MIKNNTLLNNIMFMALTAYKNYKAKFSWKKWTINLSLKVIKVEVLKYKK